MLAEIAYRNFTITHEAGRFVAKSEDDDVQLGSRKLDTLTSGIDELWTSTESMVGPDWFQAWLKNEDRFRIDLDNKIKPARSMRRGRFGFAFGAMFLIAAGGIAAADVDGDGNFDMNDVRAAAEKAFAAVTPASNRTIVVHGHEMKVRLIRDSNDPRKLVMLASEEDI